MYERWLLRKEAAEYLGLSPATLAKLASQGGGPPFFKAGKLTRYRRNDLDAWVKGTPRTLRS